MTTTTTAHQSHGLSPEALIDGEIAAALGAYYAAHDALLANDRKAGWGERYATEAEAERPALLDSWHAALVAYNVQAARYGGWSRFYLVLNSNGHIHLSTSCATCFPSTRFAWLTELSGATEADAVAEYGAQLCTVCFPSAPVEWTNGSTLGRRNQAAKDAKAAEKAARHQAKVLKALTDDLDRGLVFNVGSRTRERVTTVAGAYRLIKEALDYKYVWQYNTFADADTEVIPVAHALADRLAELAERFPEAGVKVETAEAIVDRYRTKALKEAAKQGR